MNVLITKIKQVLLEPAHFFKNLKKEKGIKSAFQYLLIFSLFATFLGFIVGQLFQNYSAWLISKIFSLTVPQSNLSMGALIFFTFLGYCMSLVFSFVAAGVLHVWILIFGGKGNYSKTYQLFVYSRTPGFIIGWIPFVGLIAWIYDLVLLIIGTQKVHSISKLKSILMYVIPAVLLGLFFTTIMIFLIYMLRVNPGIFQNAS
jgi:hypothetical protein